MKLAALFLIASSPLFAASNSIGGNVKDLNGLTVPGATIYVSNPERTFVSVSDLDGNFKFSDLEDGAYSVQAWAKDRYSCIEEVALAGGIQAIQNAELSMSPSEVPVSLKISQLNDIDSAKAFHIFVSVQPGIWTPFESEAIKAVIGQFQNGEYEVIVSRPGSAFVGTCRIFPGADGTSRIVQTDGMEISGEDYVQALALHAPTVLGSLKGL